MPQTAPATLGNIGFELLEVGATGQAVRVNQALILQDILLQGSVKDKDLNAPPGPPAAFDRYIIAGSPTGAWANKANNITGYYNSAWVFIAPKKGMVMHVEDESKDYQYDGSAWIEKTSAVTTAPTWTTVTKTSSFTASLAEAALYLIDASSGNITVTLPAAGGAGNRGFIFKRIDGTTNTVTIDGNASETIDGALTVTIDQQYGSLTISCSTNWYII